MISGFVLDAQADTVMIERFQGIIRPPYIVPAFKRRKSILLEINLGQNVWR